MAITITTAMPTSFKVELLKGLHDFTVGSSTFKMALFTAVASGSGTYGAATTNYSQMGADELATATGYTRPGQFLTSVTPTADGTTAILDFTDERGHHLLLLLAVALSMIHRTLIQLVRY